MEREIGRRAGGEAGRVRKQSSVDPRRKTALSRLNHATDNARQAWRKQARVKGERSQGEHKHVGVRWWWSGGGRIPTKRGD